MTIPRSAACCLNLVRVRLGEQLVLVDAAVVVVDALAERGELGQQPALHERRHHVVDERRHAASPRHQALADDVDVVDVEVGQVADERVRGVGLGEPDVLAVEPLQGAVRAEVDDRVGAEPHRLRGAQPRVGRHVLVVRREVVGVVQVLLVLAPAARRLREHHDVAVAQGGNDEAAVARHEGRVLGAAPVGDDLLAQLGRVVVQPLQVVAHPRARRAAVRQQLVELAGGVAAHVARAGRDALEEPVGRQVHVARAEVVAVGPHAPEDVGQRLRHVQVARADAGLPRRVVVEEDRHPACRRSGSRRAPRNPARAAPPSSRGRRWAGWRRWSTPCPGRCGVPCCRPRWGPPDPPAPAPRSGTSPRTWTAPAARRATRPRSARRG